MSEPDSTRYFQECWKAASFAGRPLGETVRELNETANTSSYRTEVGPSHEIINVETSLRREIRGFFTSLASTEAPERGVHPKGSFWSDWFEGFLSGRPLNWELQRRVALIPDEDWSQGPEHIGKIIEEIRARFELEKRIEELEGEKRVWTGQQRLEIGGNNPPEPIETPETKVIREIIWAPIEELKAETKKDKPDKGRIRAAIEKLWKGIKWIGLKATEAAIAAAVGASFANPAKAQEILTGIVEEAQKWLAALGG